MTMQEVSYGNCSDLSPDIGSCLTNLIAGGFFNDVVFFSIQISFKFLLSENVEVEASV